MALDAKNGNTLWADAISKEMENVRVAFEVLPDGKSVSIATRLCNATWYLISKWRISDVRPGLW